MQQILNLLDTDDVDCGLWQVLVKEFFDALVSPRPGRNIHKAVIFLCGLMPDWRVPGVELLQRIYVEVGLSSAGVRVD